MDAYNYFNKKFKSRLKIFNFLAIITYVIVFFTAVTKHIENGVYDIPEVFKITLLYFGILIGTNIYIKILGKLAFKSNQWLIIVILLTFPTGLYFYWPILTYHNADGNINYVKEKREDNKVLRATIKAYQQVWKKQNFVKRILVPLGYLLVAVGIVSLISLLMDVAPSVVRIGFIIILILAYVFSIALLGGFTDVRRTYVKYDMEVGQGWFDYGEVKFYEVDRKTKDETDVSFIAMIIAVPLTPIVIMAVLIGIVAFLAINLIRVVIHSNGMYSIYLHKKTMVHPRYAFGPAFLSPVMTFINRMLRFLFGINLVNKDFWFDGIAANYITSYLTEKNQKLLEKKLSKIEEKYGYYYYF